MTVFVLFCFFPRLLAATAYIHHNMDKLSRIYPAGSRTDSSNYNPVPMWNAGCQIGSAHAETPTCEQRLQHKGLTLSLSLSLTGFLPSGAELPDSLQRDAGQPGPLSAKRFLRLHPQTRIYEKPVLSVRPQQAEPGALAQEEDFSRHGEI